MKWILGLTFCLLLPSLAFAENLPTLAIYQESAAYQNDVHIGMQPYYDRWIKTGTLVETAAKQAFASGFSEIKRCEGGVAADVVLQLKHHVFF